MDIQAQTTLFRSTVMRLHQQVDKFKLPDGLNESVLGALSVFSEQLKGFTYSINQYQISRIVPNISGDVKAAVSVLGGKFRALESVLTATNALAEQTKEEINEIEEELRTLADKEEADVPSLSEDKVILEARKGYLVTDCMKKKELIDLCKSEELLLHKVKDQLQFLERSIHPNQTNRQSSEIREGKPKWIGVRWNEDHKIVSAIVLRDFFLSPLRLSVSLMRMTGTFIRSTWANLAYTLNSPKAFRVVVGSLLVSFCSTAAFAVGSVMTVGRGLYRTGVNLIAVTGLPWKAGQSNWVRKVGEGQERPPFFVQVLKGTLGGIAPVFGHILTAKGEELTSCIEGEDEWMDRYWAKWDSWVENVVSRLGPPSDELQRQNLSGIS